MSSETRTLPRLANRYPLPQWLVPAGLLFAAVIGTWVFFVQTVRGQLIDAVTWETADQRMQFLREPVRVLLGALPEVVGVLAIVAFLVLTLVQRRYFASLIALAMFLVANGSAQILKHFIFDRPDLGTGIPYYTGNSLPSGHTVFAAAAGFALVLVAQPRQRPWVAVLAATLACAVGAGTFIETWHRPADMIAAYFLAGAWTLAAAAILANRGPQENILLADDPGGISPVAIWMTLLGLLVSGLSVLFFWLAGGWDSIMGYPFEAYSLWHYLAGLALSVGPGLLTYGVVLWRMMTVKPMLL